MPKDKNKPIAAPEPPSPLPSPAPVHVTVPPWLLATIVLGLTGLAFAVGWLLSRHLDHDPAISAAAPTKRVDEIHDTPWGKLEYTRITLSPPLEYIEEMVATPKPRQWFFKSPAREELSRFFRKSGLTDAQSTALAAMGKMEGGDYVFSPDDGFVQALNAEVRKNLYTRLGQDERNSEQTNCYRYLGASIEEWLAPANLPATTIALIKALCYRNEPYWVFADISLVLPYIPTLEERGRLLHYMEAQPSWLVRLRVDKNSDINRLGSYWGRGGRIHVVRPFLEALSRNPDGVATPIKCFLPPFAETHLYSYPLPTQNPLEQNRDCHWTALNFFNEKPDDSFAANPANAVAEIQNRYYPVTANFQLGDLVVFMAKSDETNPNDRIFHSAIYIADDLVFTKNGRQAVDPWIFMRMDEMKPYYAQTGKVVVMHFRRKDVPGE